MERPLSFRRNRNLFVRTFDADVERRRFASNGRLVNFGNSKSATLCGPQSSKAVHPRAAATVCGPLFG